MAKITQKQVIFDPKNGPSKKVAQYGGKNLIRMCSTKLEVTFRPHMWGGSMGGF